MFFLMWYCKPNDKQPPKFNRKCVVYAIPNSPLSGAVVGLPDSDKNRSSQSLGLNLQREDPCGASDGFLRQKNENRRKKGSNGANMDLNMEKN